MAGQLMPIMGRVDTDHIFVPTLPPSRKPPLLLAQLILRHMLINCQLHKPAAYQLPRDETTQAGVDSTSA